MPDVSITSQMLGTFPGSLAGAVTIVAVGAAVVDVAAVTSSQNGALTSAAITGGESPTEAEHNAARADLVALRTSYNAAQVDIAALRLTLVALQDSLQAAGLITA